jgi:hypothetical protein
MLFGRLGQGRVVCGTLPFLTRELVAINPADGPDVPEHLRLWQAIGHWLFAGRELPIDAAMKMQDERYARMEANLLANGGFDDGWIMGHPAYWMAEGRQPGTWSHCGSGLSLEPSSPVADGKCLRVDTANVASLTSMAFPVPWQTRCILTGRIKGSQPGERVAVAVMSNSSGGETINVEPAVDWTSFRLRLKMVASRSDSNFRVSPVWVQIKMPKRGLVWLDDLRFNRETF